MTVDLTTKPSASGLRDPRRVTHRPWLAALTCFLAATAPELAAQAAPAAPAAQVCEMGTISEITFNRQKPFLPAATSEEASLGWLFRGLNSIHITTKERIVRWEILFEEGDCFDPVLLQESERQLRDAPYIADAQVRSDQLADGSHSVSVTTLDDWALTAGLTFSFDGAVDFSSFSFAATNVVGTGTSLAYSSSIYRARKRKGLLARQPNLLGTRIDAALLFGSTLSGQYFTESLFRPYAGEVGKHAFRQSVHLRGEPFGYSVDPSLGYTQTLLRFEEERYELTYQRRFGDEAGPRLVAGVGLSREVLRFPFGADGVQIVFDDDFDEPMAAPPEAFAEVAPQSGDYATNRASFTIGVRSLRFGPRAGLDALRATQDVLLGSTLTLTVAPGIPLGDDNVSDVLTRVGGSLGHAAGPLYLLARGDFQARNVSKDEDGGPTGWRDILWELNGIGYWAFSENSTLVSRIQYTSGSRMDRPFQLTLGGREAVRGYDVDAFPGAKRFLATLEQRISLPGIRVPFADVGLAGFVDAGKMWAGEVPYGADSDWEAGVGVGIRVGVPAAGQNVLRVDLGIPLTGQREEKGVVFRLYTELFGLIDRRSWPKQTERSRWYGVDPDLTTRPHNPIARP